MPIHSLSDLKKDDSRGSRQSGMAEALSQQPIDGEKLSAEGPHGLYHEKQVGSLCAVHAMNNLVQGPYFDEISLAEVAHGIDAQERVAMGGGWLEGQASGNVREDGFFSVQVIQEALKHQGLSCTPIGAESMKAALNDPCAEKGFILNRCATSKVCTAHVFTNIAYGIINHFNALKTTGCL